MSGTDRFITVNGIKLHYVEHGDTSSPTLLCLHGISLEGHFWDTFASQVSDRYHVLALTARGHGDSDRAESYEGTAFVEDTAAFLAETATAPAIVCGHSMGSIIGLGLAALHPDIISKLIAVDGGPDSGRTEFSRRIRQAIRSLPSSFATVEEAMDSWRAGLPGVGDEDVRKIVVHGTVQGHDGELRLKTDPGLLQALGLVESDGAVEDAEQRANLLWAACAMIKCPTLIVRGSRSTGLTHEVAERMLATIPDARLVEVDADHVVPLENAAGFYEAATTFMT